MPVDPSDPETFDDADAALDIEAPEADAAEQRQEIRPQGEEELPTGLDQDQANVADIAEQARVVELNEDDYR